MEDSKDNRADLFELMTELVKLMRASGVKNATEYTRVGTLSEEEMEQEIARYKEGING